MVEPEALFALNLEVVVVHLRPRLDAQDDRPRRLKQPEDFRDPPVEKYEHNFIEGTLGVGLFVSMLILFPALLQQ